MTRLGVGLLAACMAWSLVSGPAQAKQTVNKTMFAYAVVTKIIDDTTVEVDRGSAQYLDVGAKDLRIQPVRYSRDKNQKEVQFYLRSARAEVTAATKNTATLKLKVVAEKVRVGDALRYRIPGSPQRRMNSLFRAAVSHAVIRDSTRKRNLINFAETEAAVTLAQQDAIYERLAAEIRKSATTATRFFKSKRPKRGKYKGVAMSDVLARTTARDVKRYFDYQNAFMGSYLARSWVLHDIYGTWVLHGMDDDAGYLTRIQLEPLIERADNLVKNGRFAEAERVYRQALAQSPSYEWPKKRLNKLKRVGVFQRRLQRDPDASSTRYSLMQELYRLSAYEACKTQISELEKRKYNTSGSAYYKAMVAVRQERFGDALPYFKKRAEKEKTNKNIVGWYRYTAAKKTLKDSPGDFDAYMELADINISDKVYSTARDNFYEAMDAAKTPDDLEKAKRGVRLIAQLREMDKLKGWALDNIGNHDVKRARRRVRRVLELATLTGNASSRNDLLKEFSDKARGSKERTLAIDLLRQRTREFPKDARAWYSLAWTAYYFGDVETAEWAAGRSLAVRPNFVDGNHLKSLVSARLGDYDRALKFSKRAATHKTYAWPRLLQARVAAARGDTVGALKLIKKAHSLLPKESDIGNAMNAIIRLHKAKKALAAKKISKKQRDREQLRVVRSLSELDLAREALVALHALKKNKKLHREGAWAIVKNKSLPLRQRTEAAAATTFKADYRQTVAEQAAAASASAIDSTRARRLALARAEIKLGHFDEALAALGYLIDKRTDHDAQALVGQARIGLRANTIKWRADTAGSRGQSGTAAKLAKKAAGMYAEIGHVEGVLNANFRWAAALSAIPKREEALVVIAEGLKIATDFGQPHAIGDLHRLRGFIESATGKLDATAKALLQSRKTCADNDNEYCLATITRELGELASSEGRLHDAVRFTRESLKWAQQLGNKSLQNQALASLADVYMVMGELKESEKRAKKLLSRARAQVDYANERFALMVLGAVAMKRSQSKKARGLFADAYQVAVQLGNTAHRAQARRFMGAVHLNVDKDYKQAAERFAEAARLYKSAKSPLEAADAEMGVARAKAKLGKVEEARAAYAAALKTARKMDRRPMLARILSARAILEAGQKNGKAAIGAAKEALKLAEKLQVTNTLWTAYYALGRAQQAKGEAVKALTYFEKAIKLSSEMASKAGSEDDQAGFLSFGTTGELYEHTIALLLRMRKVNRAMEILEMSRNQKLRRIFDPGRLKSNNKKVQASLLKLRNANQRVVAAEKQLNAELSKAGTEQNAKRVEKLNELVAASNAEVRQLLLRLKKDHRNLYNAISIKPGQLVRRRKQIPEGAVIVQYFMSENTLYAFLVSRDTAQARAVQVSVKSEDINRAVSDFRRQLLDDQEELTKVSRQLNTWLLKPLEPHLGGAKTLLIVPFGMLYYLPFQALVVNDEGTPRYALEKYRIAYLSSTTMDRVLSERDPRPKPSLLAFANPDGTLPGARAETELIKSAAFPGAKIYFEKKATKKSFFDNAGKYRIIHFATHGVLDEDPLASYLVMAKKRLTVDEIAGFAGLEETTDLVVLSACSTAVELGKSTGDEVISIAEAFATAGAPALVASLWDVDDGATKELMANFYRTLQTTPDIDLLDALRKAQLKVKRMSKDGESPYSAPVFWAAFGLVGDYR